MSETIITARMQNGVVVPIADGWPAPIADILRAGRWPALDVSRAVVCGGRKFANRALVFRVLDNLRPELVIHGDCHIRLGGEWVFSGADRWADEWAFDRGVQVARCPANWRLHGSAAGPVRNKRMLRLQPTIVVAFPGGSGTESLVKQATDIAFGDRPVILQIEEAKR